MTNTRTQYALFDTTGEQYGKPFDSWTTAELMALSLSQVVELTVKPVSEVEDA